MQTTTPFADKLISGRRFCEFTRNYDLRRVSPECNHSLSDICGYAVVHTTSRDKFGQWCILVAPKVYAVCERGSDYAKALETASMLKAEFPDYYFIVTNLYSCGCWSF